MKSPITVAARKPEIRLRHWKFLPLGLPIMAVLAIAAIALFSEPETVAANSVQGVVAEAGPFDVTVRWNEFDSSTVGGYHVYWAKTTESYSNSRRVFKSHSGLLGRRSVIRSIETSPGSGKFESVEVFLPGRHTTRQKVRIYGLDGNTAYKFRVVALNTSAPAVEIAASRAEVRATTGGETLFNTWLARIEQLEQQRCDALGRSETNCQIVHVLTRNTVVFPTDETVKYTPILVPRYGLIRYGHGATWQRDNKRPHTQTCMNAITQAQALTNTNGVLTVSGSVVTISGGDMATYTIGGASVTVNPWDLSPSANPVIKTSPPDEYIRGTVSVTASGNLQGRQFFNGPCAEEPATNRTGVTYPVGPENGAKTTLQVTNAWLLQQAKTPDGLGGIGAFGNSGPTHPTHPVFDDYGEDDTAKLDLPEDSTEGTLVGEPFAATDPDGDSLTYFLDGADASAFTIDDSTGQLSVATGASFDRATKSSYAFVVIVMDDSDAAEMTGLDVIVTITAAAEDGDGSEQPDTNTDSNTDTTDQGTNDQVTTPDTAPTVADTSKLKTHYATVGQAFSLVLPAADADSGNGGPYTYSLLNRGDGTTFSANGLSFDASTRTLSGTPTALATHELSYLIHDSDDNTAESDAFAEKTKLKIVVLPGGNAVGQGQSENQGQQEESQSDSDQTTENQVVATAVTKCTTKIGTLTAAAKYSGNWDDATCKAHHEDGRARYFEFTLSADAAVTITLSDGTLYVSKDKPNNGWGKVPGPGYEHRVNVRTTNGKLLHNGPDAVTETNDGNTVTLNLKSGVTYTAEAAGTTGETFTITITP